MEENETVKYQGKYFTNSFHFLINQLHRWGVKETWGRSTLKHGKVSKALWRSTWGNFEAKPLSVDKTKQ